MHTRTRGFEGIAECWGGGAERRAPGGTVPVPPLSHPSTSIYVDGDGLFDAFVAEITHAWAGPSADRSRFLLARLADTPIGVRFETPTWASVDRVPPAGDSRERSWNQGDLFCELADLDNDGRKELVFLETARNYLDFVRFDLNRKLVPVNRWQVFEERTFRGRRSELPEPREAVIADLTARDPSMPPIVLAPGLYLLRAETGNGPLVIRIAQAISAGAIRAAV